MAVKIQVEYDGALRDAEDLTFEVEAQPWAVYRLEDGSTLKLQLALVSAARLLDVCGDDGVPVYHFTYAAIPRADIPTSLKKARKASKARKAPRKGRKNG